MLTRLYRHGPSRQSISKGYVVAGQSPEKIIHQVLGEQSRLFGKAGGTGITLRASPHHPNAIWLDTGMNWLHTFESRDLLFTELDGVVSAVAGRVAQVGGVLLPGAVSPVDGGHWRLYLCEDLHRIQTSDELETAAFCNLLRLELPTLIAASGRAGVSPRGIQAGGSRRLAESTQHHPPHYLVSASPAHLARVIRCLQRDEGIPRLDMLDVYPALANDGSPSHVELRFNDGQALLSTVRAQALLYQAMFVCARRRSRSEQIFPAYNQRVLQRNRARAIAEGLQARFEQETDDHRPQRTARQNSWYETARSALLTLVEKLQYEFQVLEVDYKEIAPLILGSTLRRLGHAALQNENDLLSMIRRQRQGEDFSHTAAQLLRNSATMGDLTSWNEQLFPAAAVEVRDWWEQFLRTPVGQGSVAANARR